MNTTLFWSLLIALQLICLLVAFFASRKQKNQTDYYVAGRQMTFFPLLMTFIATQVGGGLILGSAEDAYRLGWEIIFYPLGAISGFFLLATFLGKRLAALPVSTVAQIFEYSYGSVRLKKIASLLSIMTLFMITVAQVLASQKFLLALGALSPAWFIAFWGVVFIYTMWGGMSGIAQIDVVQASFFIAVFAMSLFDVLSAGSVASIDLSTLASSESIGTEQMVSWFLMPCLFMLIEQDMAQRCFSARSSKVMRRAALVSALVIFLICIVPIAFGLIGRANGLDVPKGQSALLVLIASLTSPAMTAAVACAVMMAIISTAVSLIHSISSNLTQDFPAVSLSTKGKLWVSRFATLGVGLGALFFARYFDNILGVLIQSYELSVACLFVPVVMSLVRKQNTALSAALSMAFGALAFIVCRAIEVPLPKEIIELLASSLGFAIGARSNVFRRLPLASQQGP